MDVRTVLSAIFLISFLIYVIFKIIVYVDIDIDDEYMNHPKYGVGQYRILWYTNGKNERKYIILKKIWPEKK